jgi:predicted AAA+ superfamily ATPase
MQEDPALEHIAAMIRSTNGSKWTLELQSDGEGSTGWYREFGTYPTDVAIYFTLTGPNSKNADIEIEDRMQALIEAAAGTKAQKRNWFVHSVDGETWKPKTVAEKIQRNKDRGDGTVTYAEVQMPSKKDRDLYFRELIGVENQLEVLCTYMETSINSNFRSRTHAVLLGPPGCGKSFTLMKVKEMFPGEAVIVIDGTSMTSAGITKMLDELEVLPRFVFIEEIDKAPNDAVAVLLGLMDKHAELNKTTYRQNIQKECRVCVFATANSWNKLKNMQEGALVSRFGNAITYKRPSPDQMRQILNAHMDDMGITDKNRGQWIERTMAWCDEWKDKLESDTQDPRFQISMCTNGREKLMNGKFQAALEATSIMRESVVEFG